MQLIAKTNYSYIYIYIQFWQINHSSIAKENAVFNARNKFLLILSLHLREKVYREKDHTSRKRLLEII